MNVLEVVHPYDWLMLIILVLTTVFGAWKGMAWQVASLASLVLSFAVALRFSPLVAPMFGENAPWNRFLAMLVLYLATGAVIWLLFRLVAGLIDLDVEVERLTKERDRVSGELEKVKKRLSNSQFVQKAPADVVEKERNKQGDFVDMISRLDHNLEMIVDA